MSYSMDNNESIPDYSEASRKELDENMKSLPVILFLIVRNLISIPILFALFLHGCWSHTR